MLPPLQCIIKRAQLSNTNQYLTPGSYMTDYRGKKRACWLARLNGYLYRINVADTDQCACGQARETVEHFLFRCQKWTAHWTELLQCTNTHREIYPSF
ncbi:Probable transposable element [Penicillium roqueforti FM164]|uniref:Probable transposable element n=1 Tax=Penicillium roqueforti (strain FM164) TaxID=1365484 RepID=W6QNS4_PENRF|nr:Probable transposable element [Penicillium roqueforti FM164]